jgi:uncharacterized phage protein gp47/JayE
VTLQPEDQDTIFTRIKNAIVAASDITNFSPNSPERAISNDAFAAEMRERQHEQLAVQLSARIGYAGKGTDDSEDPIDNEDLEALGVNPDMVDLVLLNSFMARDDLDEFVKRNGITRDPGSFATGQVTFQTSSDSVTIPEGTRVGAQPDAEGDYEAFETDEEVSPSQNSTSVSAAITAVERGSDHNVGSGTITYMPSPPPGVNSVTNNNATSGGEDEETNAELRARAKQVPGAASAGGTAGGIKNAIIDSFAGLDENDVGIDEYFNSDPQYFDVVVDSGPSDSDLQDKIDELQPVGVEGRLVRPLQIALNVTVDVTGTAANIDNSEVETDIEDYLTGLGIEEDVIRDQIVAIIMNADSDIEGIDTLNIQVNEETITFDSNTSVYKLNKGDSMESDGITSQVDDADGNTYDEGTDYEEAVTDGSTDDSIDWSIGGGSPSDGVDFYVTYDIADDIPVGSQEAVVANTVSVSVV